MAAHHHAMAAVGELSRPDSTAFPWLVAVARLGLPWPQEAHARPIQSSSGRSCQSTAGLHCRATVAMANLLRAW
jgi:hypothetical protein